MDLLTMAQALAHISSDLLLLANRDGTVWFTGPRIETMLGRPMECTLRRPLWDILPSVGPSGESSRDVEDAFRRTAAHAAQQDGVRWSPQWVVLRRADNGTVPGWLTVLWLGRSGENALVVFRAVEANDTRNATWRSVIDTIDEPLVILDRRMRVWELNAAARALLHEPGRDARGLPCWQAFHAAEDVSEDCPLPEAFGRRKTACATIDAPDGRTFEVTCWPLLDSEGRPTLVLERLRPIVRDVVGDADGVERPPGAASA